MNSATTDNQDRYTDQPNGDESPHDDGGQDTLFSDEQLVFDGYEVVSDVKVSLNPVLLMTMSR